MSNLLLRYSQALEKATVEVRLGASFQSPRAFYECRNQPRMRLQIQPDSRSTYAGYFDSGYAACLALPDKKKALRGAKIGFQCASDPEDPKVFSRTGTHKAMGGFLEGDVFCRIISPFQNIPAARSSP